ncbi:AraC family transcriptional regulator [Mesorhizobium sp. M2A.F.Ca.ET.067.02.1.1]|uniref:AraC family transcriptional regulator n=1 Tax=Mesorhizobium sp. M2A.F.Ca.ET.067.02.1.1 TaxID=2496749 RepID=UPI000FD335DB|nr:AraC family transcriptional regulator [Mesorhizobium sp. M2A.F.Ca.ET.067.02.1.1]RUW73019.1 AraC family transcriptional regulator [Mesorhizobium sp. M2A.F.Ca.ET.067.02.1.1]TIU58561.1 MAG: helix-turn-helix domain-containing protein [Mesorhizobium sp.]
MAGQIKERSSWSAYLDLPGIEFFTGHNISKRYDPHMHSSFAIGAIKAGSEHFWCRGVEHFAPPGTVEFINPGEVHKGGPGPSGRWCYQMIYAEIATIEAVRDDIRGTSDAATWFPYTVVGDVELAASIAALPRKIAAADSALERQTRMMELIGAIVVRHAATPLQIRPPGRESRAVKLARQYIDEHFAAACSLSELSKIASLSPFHFLRTFQQTVGMPPHAYLRHVRTMRAKQLMETGIPICEVAAQIGFADQSHLTRQFTRIVGVTPGAYVRAIRFKTNSTGTGTSSPTDFTR